MKIVPVLRKDWVGFSRSAHLVAFSEDPDPSWENSITFALLAIDEQADEPVAYMTVQERDLKLVHLRYGGSLGPHRGRPAIVKAHKMALDYLSKQYRWATTLIENKNLPMLKLALHNGFSVVGTELQDQKLLVKLECDLHGGN